MSVPYTYDPRKVTQTLGGQTIYGFSEGSLASISMANAISSTTTGVNGKESTININPKTDGTLTISLQHTSPFNKVLYTWAEAYKQGIESAIFLPYELKDPSGAYVSTLAWLETAPDYSLGEATGELSWVLHLQDAMPKANQSYARATGLADLLGFDSITDLF